jgi:phenylacetate-CoA ligase
MRNIRRAFREGVAWFPFALFFILDKDFRDTFERLTWNRSLLEAFQLQRIREIVRYASAHSPFYRDLYAAAGISADDIRSPSDILKLPIVTKAQLQKAIVHRTVFSEGSAHVPIAKTSTAGSTGDPLVLYFDARGRKFRYMNMKRTMWLMGALPPKRFALLWRQKRRTILQRARALVSAFKFVPVIDVHDVRESAPDAQRLRRLAEELAAFRPQVIRGYTSALWVLTQIVKKYNIPLRPERLITSAEYVPPVWWDEMEAVWGCPVHNLYGSTEASPIAASLNGRRELTVFTDFYFTEVVNNEGKWLDAGKPGRILVTDYYNQYMPLIRYEIGDVAEWGECKGEPFPYFKEVHGRVNDIFILPGGKILFSHNWHVYFREIPAISKVKIIQHDFDRISIFIEPLREVQDWQEEIEKAKTKVIQAFGGEIKIDWQIVDKLPLDAGEKFRTVRSELDAQTILKHL